MKKTLIYIVLSLCAASLLAQQKVKVLPRYKIPINSGWSFSKGESKAVEANEWERVGLPHSWNTEDPFGEEPGYYRGVGWYRKVLDTKTLPNKEKAFIYFEAANQYAQVFVNGERVGAHKGGYTAFCFDISAQLKEGENLLEVRLDNSHDPAVPPLRGDFNFYGGIYRDVYLILTDAVHFDLLDHASPGVYVSTPSVDSAGATVELRGAVVQRAQAISEAALRVIVRGPDGKTAGIFSRDIRLEVGRTTFAWRLSLAEPTLWSPAHPELYQLAIQVLDKASSRVLDEIVQPLAFRWFRFDPDDGFFLNGQPLKLIGTNRHQDFPGKANALSNAEHWRDMRMIKGLGANFFRTAHYPQDPAVLQACDRLGLLVTMEIPLDHEITDSQAFYDNSKAMMREMIRQYHNHPSIIIWAYMNEMFLGRSLERDSARIGKIVAFARELEQLTRAEDPNRYTMIPNHGDFEVYHGSGLTQIPMIVGWNLYYGWYAEGFEDFGTYIDEAHETLPDKPQIVTEYGAGADPRLRSHRPERFDFSVDWETRFHQRHLEQIMARPHVAGATVWNMFDFGSTNRNDAVPRINSKGLCSFGRVPKDPFYLYQAWLKEEPFVKILSTGWNERIVFEPQAATQRIEVCGNVERAELWHNGQNLGARTLQDHRAAWEVPLVRGQNRLELRAVGEELQAKDQLLIDCAIVDEGYWAEQAFLSVNYGTDLQFQDEAGQLWIPEPGRGTQPALRESDRRSGHNVRGTQKDPLYQSQRVGVERLSFQLPAGQYRLHLHFAELEEKEAGERVFAIQANGNLLHPGLDIAGAHGLFKATRVSTVVNVGQTGLELEFLPIAGAPVLNALQLERVGY
jgi:beta-galactosidase